MEDKFLLELLEARYRESRDRFKDGQHSHEDLTIMMLKHQTNHIAHLEIDLNQKIDQIDDKIDQQNKELNLKIDQQNKELNQKIDQQSKEFNLKIDQQSKEYNQKINQVNQKIDHHLLWQLGTSIALAAIIVASIKFF